MPFRLREVPVYRFDQICLGSGVGGSAAALAASREGASVALLSKGPLSAGNTRWAQGGMAAVLGDDDHFDSHIADTMEVGCGLSERDVVETVVRGGPGAVERLLELGAEFDRDADGGISLSREGGHSHPRIVHAHGDATGREIQRSLDSSVRADANITVFENTFAIDLLTEEGRAIGVLCRTERGDIVLFHAPRICLATGGAGQIYRETTNPVVATGDGVALAFRAGATVRDLEFVQFHPTCLYIAGAARHLISEIVRGHGGILRDRHGERFMPLFHKDAELAPRDVVSRAVFRRMVETQDTNVYLDVTRCDGDPHKLFPGISSTCRFFGIDIAKDAIPVRPGAHYMIGGIRVDQEGRVDGVPGLWAVGECASTGLHGANRMGSNSLLEGLVLGWSTGASAARDTDPGLHPNYTAEWGMRNDALPAESELRVNVEDVLYSLKSLMWRHMGVQRDAELLAEADEKIAFWCRVVQQLAPNEPRAFELQNMLTVSRLATLGALAREESRGVHYRTDFPDTEQSFRKHTLLKPRVEDEMIANVELSSEPVDGALSASTPA